MNFQPAEVAKIAVLGIIAFSLSNEKKTKGECIYSKCALFLLIPISFIMIQPDFGSAFVLVVAAFFLLFAAGLPLKFFISIGLSGIIAFILLIVSAPYRLVRIQAFLDPWQDPLGSGFQAIQSLLAIGPAGLFGFGYGNSRQKFLYLPEPQNDFIFSILLEETGFYRWFNRHICICSIFYYWFLCWQHVQKKSWWIYHYWFYIIIDRSNIFKYGCSHRFVTSYRSYITFYQLWRVFISYDLGYNRGYMKFIVRIIKGREAVEWKK